MSAKKTNFCCKDFQKPDHVFLDQFFFSIRASSLFWPKKAIAFCSSSYFFLAFFVNTSLSKEHVFYIFDKEIYFIR